MNNTFNFTKGEVIGIEQSNIKAALIFAYANVDTDFLYKTKYSQFYEGYEFTILKNFSITVEILHY
jgi:hypothetical protein